MKTGIYDVYIHLKPGKLFRWHGELSFCISIDVAFPVTVSGGDCTVALFQSNL